MGERLTRRALETLRAPSVQAHASYAVLCAVSLALGLGLQLDARLHFEYRSAHGVIGWVSVNEYAKSQEDAVLSARRLWNSAFHSAVPVRVRVVQPMDVSPDGAA